VQNSRYVSSTSPVVGFILALAIGLLIGRTREPVEGRPPRPGIRDFLIIAMLGAIAGHIGNLMVAFALFAATVGAVLLMRAHHPERTGITTELAAIATFALAALCMTGQHAYGAGLGIVLAMILVQRDEIRRFVREEISDAEYIDTLSFLGLIFIIYPLLPDGGYGPFEFFEPRRIWKFVILVSGVSYVGYFLSKFGPAQRAALMTAVVGSLASTTAYTTALSRSVAESPESAVPATRFGLIANSIMFPRMIVIVAPIAGLLAISGIPAFAAMMLTGFIMAMLVSRAEPTEGTQVSPSTFKNPFSLKPALQFGVVVAIVMLLARAGRHYLGSGGQLVVAAISGLVDVDAISLTLAGSVQSGNTTVENALIGMTLAAGVNAIFKSFVAQSSGQPAFYLRMMAGFAAMFVVGAAVLAFVDPAPFVHIIEQIMNS